MTTHQLWLGEQNRVVLGPEGLSSAHNQVALRVGVTQRLCPQGPSEREETGEA